MLKTRSIVFALCTLAGATALSGATMAAEDHGKIGGYRNQCPPICEPAPGGRPVVEPPRGERPPEVRPPRDRRDRDARWRHDRRWRHYDRGFRDDWRPGYYTFAPRYYDYGFYDDPGYDDGYVYYDDRPIIRRGISCGRAASALRAAGYRSIVTIECRGSSYTFKALKAGKRYKLTVSARSGKILNRVRG